MVIIGVYFEQVAFVGALSAIVLALLWPHARPLILSLSNKLYYLLEPLKKTFYNQSNQESNDLFHPVERGIGAHPKSRSQTKKEKSLRLVYRSSQEGFAQSPLAGNVVDPTFASSPNGFLVAEVGGARQAGLPLHGGQLTSSLNNNNNNTNQYSTLLTMFSASVIALLFYTTIRMFTFKLGASGRKKATTNRSGLHDTASWQSASSSRRGIKTTRKDMRSDMRASRQNGAYNKDEQVRRLIMHHGGKNVSTAIKFLVGELEKQKRLLYENLLSESSDLPQVCCSICCPRRNSESNNNSLFDDQLDSGSVKGDASYTDDAKPGLLAGRADSREIAVDGAEDGHERREENKHDIEQKEGKHDNDNTSLPPAMKRRRRSV